MASIDKIYGTGEQQRELYYWLKYNKPQLLHQLYFYFSDDLEEEGYPHFASPDTEDVTISNFRYVSDLWLMSHCPIVWVQERLMEQYADFYCTSRPVYFLRRIRYVFSEFPEFISGISYLGFLGAFRFYIDEVTL